MDLSVMYFSCQENDSHGGRYDFLKETIQQADERGFKAAWLPERHFNPFGGIFPNAAQLCAAMAMITKQIRLRSGSVILPLHHPAQLAEEWSVADNLSNGRVDLSITPGWNARDFIMMPGNYQSREELTSEGVETLLELWRGETVSFKDGNGELQETKIYPAPVQKQLNIWLTCGGKNKQRFIEAGAKGFNVLTALLLQTKEELEENITVYRKARADNRHDPETGTVTLMLHTFVGKSEEVVRSIVKEPFTSYLESSVQLWSQMSKKLDELDEYKRRKLLDFAFEKYYHSSALFGTTGQVSEKLGGFESVGVNEIACLIDFGPSLDRVSESLRLLGTI